MQKGIIWPKPLINFREQSFSNAQFICDLTLAGIIKKLWLFLKYSSKSRSLTKKIIYIWIICQFIVPDMTKYYDEMKLMHLINTSCSITLHCTLIKLVIIPKDYFHIIFCKNICSYMFLFAVYFKRECLNLVNWLIIHRV